MTLSIAELDRYEEFRSETLDIIKSLRLAPNQIIWIELEFLDFHDRLIRKISGIPLIPAPTPTPPPTPPRALVVPQALPGPANPALKVAFGTINIDINGALSWTNKANNNATVLDTTIQTAFELFVINGHPYAKSQELSGLVYHTCDGSAPSAWTVISEADYVAAKTTTEFFFVPSFG